MRAAALAALSSLPLLVDASAASRAGATSSERARISQRLGSSPIGIIEPHALTSSHFKYFQPQQQSLPIDILAGRDPECPPCPPSQWNCQLPAFKCLNSGVCSEYDGQCICPDGFGGMDCGKPLDGSLSDGKDRFPREGNEPHCKEGWTGLTCNVCESNEVCRPLVPDDDDRSVRPGGLSINSRDKDDPEDAAVCYKGGYAVKQVHEMCDVTNRKILDMLPDRPPQVTFTCNRDDKTCGFQFWVGGIESFYCGLQECAISGEATQSANLTKYDCQKITCECIPDRMLCGEAGSVNIDEFLSEEIKGPGTFSCNTDGSECLFTEPAMNNLINDIFGDEYITLRCNAGECLHYSMVPGFEAPRPPDNSKLVAASIAVTGLLVIIACAAFWYFGRTSKHDFGHIRLSGSNDDSDEVGRLIANRVPASLSFKDISYHAPNGRQILSDVSGNVRPGQLLAFYSRHIGEEETAEHCARQGMQTSDHAAKPCVNKSDVRAMTIETT